MASYQQLYYCKNCKKNVSINDKGQCLTCHSTQIKKTWSVRFRVVEMNGEKQKRLTGFQTKKEAQDAYFKFLTESKAKPIENQPSGLSFASLFSEYQNLAKTKLKESSYYDFCSKANLHIVPFFKDVLVKDITPKMLLDWQNGLFSHTYTSNGKNKTIVYSYKYKSNLRMYLNSILNHAEKYYNIENQLRKVDKFRNVELKKEMLFWTPEEFALFINKVDSDVFKTFFYALYYTGARKGEILATTWNDWDLKNGLLNINKTVTKKVYGSPWLVTKPKNQSSIRTISLPDCLIEVIKNYKKGKENNKFVFYGDKPLPDTSIERAKRQACTKSGVKEIRIHDFRHSHASLLLGNGVSVVAVAKRLGHSNTEQTLNTYAHMLPREDELLISVLQNTIKSIKI